MFELDDYILFSHLRMEGKYLIKNNEPITKHNHVIFYFNDFELCYHDVRKFGKMHLIGKEDIYNIGPLTKLGLEPFDKELTTNYLKNKLKNKRIPIKTALLDQSIIAGIGNIYIDEILFLAKINPLIKSNRLTSKQLSKIIASIRVVLTKAISLRGTTIRTYSSLGEKGKYQNNLLAHNRAGKKCLVCSNTIKKIRVNGRGTYYCPNCQKPTTNG